MTSPPSADLLGQLTPFLESLACLVAARGSQLSETELNMLLLCVGMESDAAALEELTRWGRLLAALHQDPPDSLRRAAVEGLILRGLPEAAVLAAVSIVVESASARTEAPKANDGHLDPGILGSDESASFQALKLTASVERLDFGMLAPGQSGSLRFEVGGGQGHIFVEGEQIRVTPEKFGPKPTRVRVEVRPRGGDLLWDSVRLVTDEGTIEIPVVAQWVESPRVTMPLPSVLSLVEPRIKGGRPAAHAVQTPSLGHTWTRPADGMVMVYVPAGEFQMGSNDGDSDERPVHTVTLDGFWLDRTPVTNAQFALFLNAEGNQEEGGVTWVKLVTKYSRIGRVGRQYRHKGGYADHPVTGVSWYGAAAYAQWAEARLPTEAEWEYAARGPEGRVYPWGDRFEASRLNCEEAAIGDTTLVVSYRDGTSWCGALDMAGNVWEWVADWYGDYPSARQVKPTGPASGTYRVLRGGSWGDTSNNVRGAYRGRDCPGPWIVYYGFRCARSS